jgi:gluconolactonase
MSISLLVVAALVGFPQPPAQPQAGSSSVVAPGAKLEKVWGEGEFTEGGAMAADGSILFSDIGNRILRFDPKSGKTTVFREPSGRANGLIFNSRGQLIVAEGANVGGGRRVSITDRDGTIRTLVDSYDSKRLNSPNDVAVDRDGRVYVSDPRYVGNEPRDLDLERVYVVEPEGFITALNLDVFKPNGLAISPDGQTLYVSDNGSKRRALVAARIGAMGKVSNSRVIHEFRDQRGIDGMTVTTDGRIVAAAGGGAKAGAYIFSPDGKLLEIISTPEDPANVEFGGDDRKTLYICAGKSLYRIKTTMTGFALWPPASPAGP